MFYIYVISTFNIFVFTISNQNEHILTVSNELIFFTDNGHL